MANDSTTTATQLEGLHDLAVPEPVSWMPQTGGWLVLLVLVLLALVWIVRRYQRQRSANRYRDEALAELAAIERALADPTARPAALAALSELVKRTALSVACRRDVAALVGEPWRRELDASYGGDAFESGAGRLLDDVAYRTPAALAVLSDRDVAALVDVVRDWIRRHRVPGHDGARRAAAGEAA
jgi:hypothetical protein